jgi:NADPH2:quinone reductase
MTEMMWALRVKALEGPDAIEMVSVGAPKGGPNDVVVEVHAAGVGFADLLMTRGQYQFRPEPPFIGGVEVAGVVRSAPTNSSFTAGDRVSGSVRNGAWAEVAVTSPFILYPIPDGMSFEQATSLINYQTAVFAFVERGGLRAGETVLIHGAAGGTGTAAIEVARGFGAKVIAVAHGEDKLRTARELGAEHCVEADSEWQAEVRRITNDRGVEVVYDPVGGDRFLDSVRALAPGGRLLIIGFAAGTIPEIRVNRLLLRNTSLVGAAWAEWVRHDPLMPQRCAKEIEKLWQAGRINPVVESVYPLDQGADALREIAERRAIGKIVLKVR